MGVTLACLLATLVTPYHFRLYAVVIDMATQTGVNNVIGELLPMDFRSPGDWAMLGCAGCRFCLGTSPRHGLLSFDALLLIAGACFSFRTCRDVWFAVLASLTILITSDRPEAPLADLFHLDRRRLLTLAVAVAMLLAVLGWRRGLSQTSQGGGWREVPCGGRRFYRETRLCRVYLQPLRLGRLSHLAFARSEGCDGWTCELAWR